MSSVEKNRNEKIKNGTLLYGELIQYNKEKNKFFKSMKNGYIEMGKINLQLASDNESELVEINNYETWLCGV
ncbi:MAG: hypothetical protein E7213_04665 [Clostridium sp.]|nr:hypothetical protein [Clostridium sp.]